MTNLTQQKDGQGGGLMTRTKYISDEFYHRYIKDVIREIFKCNGKEDAFGLCATDEMPDKMRIFNNIEDAEEFGMPLSY